MKLNTKKIAQDIFFLAVDGQKEEDYRAALLDAADSTDSGQNNYEVPNRMRNRVAIELRKIADEYRS